MSTHQETCEVIRDCKQRIRPSRSNRLRLILLANPLGGLANPVGGLVYLPVRRYIGMSTHQETCAGIKDCYAQIDSPGQPVRWPGQPVRWLSISTHQEVYWDVYPLGDIRRNQGLKTVHGGGRCENGGVQRDRAWHVGGFLGSEMRDGLPGSGMRDGLWEQSANPQVA